MQSLRKDFPIFETSINKRLIYLDNGATTQKPQVLVKAISDYYQNINSNIGRGVYSIAEQSELAYENSRKKIAKFLNCSHRNITFTSGTTSGINEIAYIVSQYIEPKKKIVLSILEHHANILPWQRLAKEKDLEIVFIKDFSQLANPEMIEQSFWENVAVISLTHVSNVTGQIIPIEKWCSIAREKDIITVIDGAQGVSSCIIDLSNIGCDFYVFSAHKLYGPMGLGIIYMDKKFIKKSQPFILGGGIIDNVNEKDFSLIDDIHKFEAGTPNVANVVAFSSTLDYLEQNNWRFLLDHLHVLGQYLYKQLKTNTQITILNDEHRNSFSHSHIVSFKIDDIHSHDVGTYLANYNIAVRVGKHCTYPLHNFLQADSSIRVSLGIYNNKEDIDMLLNILNKCILFFKGQ